MPKCPICSKEVYFGPSFSPRALNPSSTEAERREVYGKHYHPGCLKCHKCMSRLTLGQISEVRHRLLHRLLTLFSTRTLCIAISATTNISALVSVRWAARWLSTPAGGFARLAASPTRGSDSPKVHDAQYDHFCAQLCPNRASARKSTSPPSPSCMRTTAK